jgi:hypothetical protein
MKSIRYPLLISTVFCFCVFVRAQNPSDTPKVKKSSPVPARPITPAPGTTTAPRVQPSTTPGVKKSSPIPTPRLSRQRNSNNLNNAQPAATPAATQPATTATQVDPNLAVSNVMMNISLIAGIPQGQFATNTNNDWGWGLDVSMLFNLGQKRPKSDWQSQPINVYMGGSFQYMYHGGKTDTYSYNDQFSETTIDSKVNNNMWGLGFVTRAEFFSGPVKPFVELVAGVRFFTGSHRIDYTNELYNTSDPNTTRRQSFNNNLATSPVGYYGAGGGLRIGSEKVRVELKLTYSKGSKAEYVDLDKIEFDRTDNSITYTTKKSTTDMVIPQLGVSLIF